MPLSKASRAREQDILDQYHLGQITREVAAKQLTELYRDHYEAYASVRLADECKPTEDRS